VLFVLTSGKEDGTLKQQKNVSGASSDISAFINVSTVLMQDSIMH
jgi:hypothetical protein